VSISDGTKSYSANASDQVVGAAPVAGGATKAFTVSYNLALATGNDCQNKSATVSLTVKAVQSDHNINATNDGPLSWN
jgi:hypothetical protein